MFVEASAGLIFCLFPIASTVLTEVASTIRYGTARYGTVSADRIVCTAYMSVRTAWE